MRLGLAVLCIALASCGASRGAYEAGQRSAKAGDWDQAVAFYEKAAREDPESVELRIALRRARLEASRLHLTRARNLKEAGDSAGASAELELALRYDPGNEYARDELRASRKEPEPPIAAETRIRLKFAEETSLEVVLRALGKLAGVNVLFDETFRDRSVTVDLDDVTFEQALELLLTTNGLFYKRMDSSTVRIATPSRRERSRARRRRRPRPTPRLPTRRRRRAGPEAPR
jgi:general secretion pathway protein D